MEMMRHYRLKWYIFLGADGRMETNTSPTLL